METLGFLAGIIAAGLLMPVAAPLFLAGSMLVISVCLAPFGWIAKVISSGQGDNTQ